MSLNFLSQISLQVHTTTYEISGSLIKEILKYEDNYALVINNHLSINISDGVYMSDGSYLSNLFIT